jgi:hypothetical protein
MGGVNACWGHFGLGLPCLCRDPWCGFVGVLPEAEDDDTWAWAWAIWLLANNVFMNAVAVVLCS